ncbi:MAG: bifunctional hydroxymethylpyrimidine kinase/phosphomethylpyrimidine kinase, partial [Geminicoccaceae bacterium]
LLQPDAVSALIAHLLPLALVITPNLPEAGVLLDRRPPTDLDGMRVAAADLRALGPNAVLLKGGHLTDGDAVDIFDDGASQRDLRGRRFATGNTHGTGCTLSAALATLLGQGISLEDAASMAKDYVGSAIANADRLHVGKGHGPVHHFHALWQSVDGGHDR